MRWVGHLARIGEMRIEYKSLVMKLQLKRSLGARER